MLEWDGWFVGRMAGASGHQNQALNGSMAQPAKPSQSTNSISLIIKEMEWLMALLAWWRSAANQWNWFVFALGRRPANNPPQEINQFARSMNAAHFGLFLWLAAQRGCLVLHSRRAKQSAPSTSSVSWLPLALLSLLSFPFFSCGAVWLNFAAFFSLRLLSWAEPLALQRP